MRVIHIYLLCFQTSCVVIDRLLLQRQSQDQDRLAVALHYCHVVQVSSSGARTKRSSYDLDVKIIPIVAADTLPQTL
ncbi:uncharacterized protein F4817DRAFT_186174 [Daldinia loculata]|uniref:uncharacterized protein n=1 Tax=Daldinia loculata TaxID=103429 RepID=UPI0020C42E33|nr:uncharacterized protein F4817DRAFT_186174 [Daldinia loculata]KAI1645409.1 hypothetical protein F4817DRAFT_186174 [Daldinia loculata]